MHIGTCQGLASQRPEGAPAGDFKSPNAFQKGTKTFCLTKASTGEEQPSPFLFKSLYFPAGWPGHSLSLFFFFSYYKRSQLQHTGKKKPSPRPGQGPGCSRSRLAGLLPQTKAAPASGTHWERPWSHRPEPRPQRESGEGSGSFCQPSKPSAAPGSRAAIRPSQGLLEESVCVKQKMKHQAPLRMATGFRALDKEGPQEMI